MLRVLQVLRYSTASHPLCTIHHICQWTLTPICSYCGFTPKLLSDWSPRFVQPSTHRTRLPGALSAPVLSLWVANWEPYSSKGGKGRKKKTFGEEDRDSSDEEDDETWDMEESWSDEEVTGPKTWKDLVLYVPSLRVDAILSTGLGISRKKVEDAYLAARVTLNDKVIPKKAKGVKEGDVLDIILEGKNRGEEEVKAVMRVKVIGIGREKTDKDRFPIKMRRWKYLEIK